MQREFDALWKEVDCLVTPATPCAAPKIGQKTIRLGGREEDLRLAVTRFARAINLLGVPALSIPCGITAAGLPIGLQIIGPAFQEASILRVGAALEDAGLGIPPCPTK
jgi:aspartyl-tRNA(Asn)/glutamyl-tRNA(Gln) amidotransferase subunit A